MHTIFINRVRLNRLLHELENHRVVHLGLPAGRLTQLPRLHHDVTALVFRGTRKVGTQLLLLRVAQKAVYIHDQATGPGNARLGEHHVEGDAIAFKAVSIRGRYISDAARGLHAMFIGGRVVTAGGQQQCQQQTWQRAPAQKTHSVFPLLHSCLQLASSSSAAAYGSSCRASSAARIDGSACSYNSRCTASIANVSAWARSRRAERRANSPSALRAGACSSVASTISATPSSRVATARNSGGTQATASAAAASARRCNINSNWRCVAS